ncbi:MAG TPA: response regulator [Pyrinomonadaceae bacterium]|nr:response regulator [Pyrinomonadaceae bacterium]
MSKPLLKNLLIVEDNASMRRLIKSVVEDLAVNIHECDDGAKALAAYEAHCPEWILMDVEMHEKDGFTATKEIMQAHPEAKVLILTKYSTQRMREEAEKAGACEYVLKENLLSIRQKIH